MSEATRLGLQPPGWLFDNETGQTRWWNGAHWTDHAKPLAPVVRTATVEGPPQAAPAAWSSYDPAPISRNAPAKVALVLLALALVGAGVAVWQSAALDPAITSLIGLAQVALGLTAFVLSVVGLVIAIRRPTRKAQAILGVVLSTLFLGFLAFRIAAATTGGIDSAALEGEIEAWALSQTGEVTEVVCPASPPTATGAVFSCTAMSATGAPWTVAVTVQDDVLTWSVAP